MRLEATFGLATLAICALLFAGCAAHAPVPSGQSSHLSRPGTPARPTEAQAQLDQLESQLSADLVSTDALVMRETGRVRVRLVANVAFVADSVAIQSGTEQVLADVTRLLDRAPQLGVLVQVFADDLQPDAVAKQFTALRAETVATLFRQWGIAPARIVVLGAGSGSPIAGNDTPEGRRANRRLELLISPLSS